MLGPLLQVLQFEHLEFNCVESATQSFFELLLKAELSTLQHVNVFTFYVLGLVGVPVVLFDLRKFVVCSCHMHLVYLVHHVAMILELVLLLLLYESDVVVFESLVLLCLDDFPALGVLLEGVRLQFLSLLLLLFDLSDRVVLQA